MKPLILALKKASIVYVTRDLERALGGVLLPNYYIITNTTPFAKTQARNHQNIILLPGKKLLDTSELLGHPATAHFLKKLTNPRLVVFKNTLQIEKICQKNNWTLLNPSAALAGQVEEKISQVSWLGTNVKYLPPHKIMLGKNLEWKGEKYIIQFNRAHTGTGTMLATSETQIAEIRNKFPNREVRVTKFIAGPAFTSNNVVWGKNVFTENISYQITGLAPFTDNVFATIGNDWRLPSKLLNDKQENQFKKIANDVGKKLARDGWIGLFGIDSILDDATGKIFLIEINARQPASTTYESELQKKNTTFEAHLAALLGLPAKAYKLQPIQNGAQIIQRMNNSQLPITKQIQNKLKKNGLNIIPYTNSTPGSDLLRIQSKKSFMAGHNQFNVLGESIKKILS